VAVAAERETRSLALALGALTVAGLIAAPVAVAGPQCTQTGPTTTQCETNGSAQIVTSPPNVNNGPWYPYGGFGISIGGIGIGW